MIPGLDLALLGGQGGLQASSSASANTGQVNFGAFTFQPKGGSFPPVAWIALAAAAVLVAAIMTRGR